MTVAVICTAVLGLMVFGMGFWVSIMRGRAEVLGGAPEQLDSPLYKTVRAHGNTTEYAPFLAILFLYLGAQGPAQWVLWTMAVVTLCRVLMVAGLMASATLAEPHPLRLVGALGTYVGGTLLCVLAILSVLG